MTSGWAHSAFIRSRPPGKRAPHDAGPTPQAPKVPPPPAPAEGVRTQNVLCPVRCIEFPIGRGRPRLPRRSATTLPSDAQAAKDRLMEAAEACFDKYGVAKTTMDDIAKVAGVSRPTVYR